jgi:CheY-like chemotaxis protein
MGSGLSWKKVDLPEAAYGEDAGHFGELLGRPNPPNGPSRPDKVLERDRNRRSDKFKVSRLREFSRRSQPRKQCLNFRRVRYPGTLDREANDAMAGRGPTILVVDDDLDERVVIAAVLRDAGFAVVAAAHGRGARALLARERFAAAVIALPEEDGVEFQRHLRRHQPNLYALIVIEPAATRFADADGDTLLSRPFDPGHLLGCVFELVLREAEDGTPCHSHAAEFGIAAARLACLGSRRTAAARRGLAAIAIDGPTVTC